VLSQDLKISRHYASAEGIYSLRHFPNINCGRMQKLDILPQQHVEVPDSCPGQQAGPDALQLTQHSPEQ